MPLFQRNSKALVVAPAFDNAALILLWLHGRPETTQAAYKSDLARLLEFLGDKPLNLVELRDLQAFADSLAYLAPASQARILKACKSVLSFGAKTMPALFPANVGAALLLPKTRHKLAERILDEESVLRMFAMETDARNHAILRLLYGSAIRRSELVGLRWQDMHARSDGGSVTVFGKGGKTRTIWIKSAIYQEVQALRGNALDDAPVFDLSASRIYQIVKAAAKRAGIDKPVSPHWMRHAHISHALDHGAPIHLVQQTSGHANLAILSDYAHARPNEGSGKYLP